MVALKGRCLCGAVGVTLDRPPVAVGLCHCTHCRRTSGSAFAVVGFVPAGAVAIRGEPASYADRADSGAAVERRFCGTCGSPVETVAAAIAAAGLRLLKMGLFDPADFPAPSTELFCVHRTAWLPPLRSTAGFDHMPPRGDKEFA